MKKIKGKLKWFTNASNARIQVPLISVAAEEEEEEAAAGPAEEEEEEAEVAARRGAVPLSEWVIVKPLNLQLSLPASTRVSNRSDLVRSKVRPLRAFRCSSSHAPNSMMGPALAISTGLTPNERWDKL
jgi:hypothetical protein